MRSKQLKSYQFQLKSPIKYFKKLGVIYGIAILLIPMLSGLAIQNITSPKVQAASIKPIRVVVLLPSNGSDASKLELAKSIGQEAHDWYCEQVGSCYAYQGATVFQGTQTEQYYSNNCNLDTCSGKNLGILGRIAQNVLEQNPGTVVRDDVVTLVIPAWPTSSYFFEGTCGATLVGNKNFTVMEGYHIYDPTRPERAGCAPYFTGAHELGHVFGLSPTDDEHTSNKTLMDALTFCNIVPNETNHPNKCVLDPAQVRQLQITPHIFPPRSGCDALNNSVSEPTGGQNMTVRTFTNCITDADRIGNVEVRIKPVEASKGCPVATKTTNADKDSGNYGETTFTDCTVTNMSSGKTPVYQISSIVRPGYHVKTTSPSRVGTSFYVYPNKTPVLRIVMEKDEPPQPEHPDWWYNTCDSTGVAGNPEMCG